MERDIVKLACITFLAIIFVARVDARQISQAPAIDSISLRSLVFPQSKPSLWEPSIHFQELSSNTLSEESFRHQSLKSALLWELPAEEAKLDVIASLRISQTKQDPLEVIRKVLGAAQGAGAIYLGYRVIKKYGFMK